MTPAIVLGSHTIGLGLIRGLGEKGVPVFCLYYEKKDMGYVSKYVRESRFVAHPEWNQEEFISSLCQLKGKAPGAVVFPGDDATLKAVSRHKDFLNASYRLACPEWEIAEKCIDKKQTYLIAEELGIPHPVTRDASSMESALEAAGTMRLPCLLKPRQSHIFFEKFKKKAIVVQRKEEVRPAFRMCTEEGQDVMVQEYIPGGDSEGVNYNSFYVGGKPLVEFTSRKCRLSYPGFGVPRVVRSERIPEILNPARKLLGAMKYTGYSCVEFKRDTRDGVYKLLEINARHNRSGILSTRCGINFPFIEYQSHVNGAIPKPATFKEGVHWIDEISDLVNTLRYYREERYSASQYVRPYLGNHVFTLCDGKDVKPFFKRINGLVRMGAEAVMLRGSKQDVKGRQ
jgi:predicted ATP-grasp superfamily ATP-dependent carboligase